MAHSREVKVATLVQGDAHVDYVSAPYQCSSGQVQVCWQDCHAFSTTPVHITAGATAYGTFCSTGCARRYILDKPDYAQKDRELVELGIGDPHCTAVAPPREALALFGGPLTLQAYREISEGAEGAGECRARLPPMIPQNIGWELVRRDEDADVAGTGGHEGPEQGHGTRHWNLAGGSAAQGVGGAQESKDAEPPRGQSTSLFEGFLGGGFMAEEDNQGNSGTVAAENRLAVAAKKRRRKESAAAKKIVTPKPGALAAFLYKP